VDCGLKPSKRFDEECKASTERLLILSVIFATRIPNTKPVGNREMTEEMFRSSTVFFFEHKMILHTTATV